MDTIQQIIAIVGAIVGIIATATGLLIPLIKNVKAKQALLAINKIMSQIQPFVMEAEKFSGYSGAEKKQYVLTKINDYAIKHSIVFNEEQVSALIEQVVITTKAVNARDKDKVATPATAE